MGWMTLRSMRCGLRQAIGFEVIVICATDTSAMLNGGLLARWSLPLPLTQRA